MRAADLRDAINKTIYTFSTHFYQSSLKVHKAVHNMRTQVLYETATFLRT
jgi:hypothetical protein